jgi:hypothetical protein
LDLDEDPDGGVAEAEEPTCRHAEHPISTE